MLKLWLMNKYCPRLWFDMPREKDNKEYVAEAVILHGYWGDKIYVAYAEPVIGLQNAYLVSRWLALKAQFRYPNWLYDCGVNYRVRESRATTLTKGIV